MTSAVVNRPRTVVSLWEMLQLLAGDIISSVNNIALIAHQLTEHGVPNTSGVTIERSAVVLLRMSVEAISAPLNELEMIASRAAADRCLSLLRDVVTEEGFGGVYLSGAQVYRLVTDCTQLTQSFTDEIHARAVFTLPPKSAKLLESAEPFGSLVDSAFPLAAEDVSEAAKCLALGRYTASVFHLMRAMEVAVQALASRVGTQNVDKEWGKLLSEIGKSIEAMPKGAERNRWSESHSHLYHVKQAWRNDTMHPKSTYSEERASDIFQAVRSFMTHLAGLVT